MELNIPRATAPCTTTSHPAIPLDPEVQFSSNLGLGLGPNSEQRGI